jgi:RHS repeat-associated protein
MTNALVSCTAFREAAAVDDVDYTYDAAGNRLSMTDETGTTEYEHDAMDRTTSVTFPGDSTVSYEYDEVGNRTKLTYPDTNEVDYTYDEAHDLETVTDWLDNVTTYAYDDAGQRIDTDLPNGVHTDHSYDGAGRLESVVNIGPGPTTISSFTYTRDAAGNRIEMEDLDGVHSYEYDPLDRLTEVTYPDQETDTYTYNAAAIRLTKDTDDYTYTAASELTDVEGVTYDYDENGNEIARGNDAFEYDHENRLVESVIDSVTSSSTYNGDGLRMSHTVGQTTTDYIWDVASGLPVVLEDGTNTYVYGLDLISATDGQAAQVYFLADGLGSTTDLTDGNGDVVDSYTYDVFGATRSQAGSSDNYWLYTGEQRDDDSTFYYLRARYYDPSIGRFTAQDPLPGSVPQSQNLYTYVGCNPVSRSDPMGLRLIDEPGYGGDGGPLPPLPPNCWYVQVQSPPPPPPDTCQVSPNTPGCNPDWGIECPGGSLPGYYWLADRMDWVGDRVGDVGEWLSTRTPKCYILAGLYARTCGAAAVAACSTGGGIVVGGYVAGSYPCTALLASVLIACSEDR